jgi:hypothetical protein
MIKLGVGFSALCLIASVANAFPFWDRPAGVEKPVDKCTDFSGEYRGACVVQGKQVAKSFNLQQSGCETFTANGMDIRIGSLLALSVSAPAQSGIVKYAWDKNQKNLLNMVASMSALSPFPFAAKCPLREAGSQRISRASERRKKSTEAASSRDNSRQERRGSSPSPFSFAWTSRNGRGPIFRGSAYL